MFRYFSKYCWINNIDAYASAFRAYAIKINSNIIKKIKHMGGYRIKDLENRVYKKYYPENKTIL